MAEEARPVDVMVREALRRARAWEPSWSEAKRASATRNALRGITSSSPIFATFDAIRRLLPFAAGMIDVLSTSRAREPANLVYDVPDGFLADRARRIDEDPAIPLAITCPDGLALRGTDAMPHGTFHENPYCQAMYSRFGLDNVTGMILSPRRGLDTRDVVVLWMFSGNGARLPTWEECRLLERVCPHLWEAMERIRLPLVPHQQVLFQILQEQDVGYVVLRQDGTLLEVNRRAVLLSQRYGGRAAGSWRAHVEQLTSAARAASGPGSHARGYIPCPDGSELLEVSLHRLAKEHYAISEDVTLVQFKEIPRVRSAETEDHGPLGRLSPRQQEIASLLVESGLSYKQIADKLALSEGTVRTHIERLYRTLRAHSRPELVELFRRHASTRVPR